ncbi:MAG: Xaa-Pro peptidase family protein [Bellilinea sp.]|nr:Xaa-Pro peptidase family protein [Bellilinea sp.]
MTHDRLARLIALMNAANLDAIALIPSQSLVYLTGLHFHLSERPTTLIITPPHTPVLIVPELETGKARRSKIPLQLIPFGDNPADWEKSFKEAVDICRLQGKIVGVEPTRFRFLEWQFIQTAARDVRFVSAEPALNVLRLRKDEQELAAMRRAVNIAERAFEQILPLIKAGITERELAAELTVALLRNGSAPELPFAPIVAFGANSANPHAVPGDTPLKSGDLVLFDWGASYEDYFSDITRTLALGDPGEELRHIYNIVLRANQEGRGAGKPGLPAGAVDRAARRVIEEAKYGDFFIHRTGHGLGMESHEPPYLYAENPLSLESGMVYTVEPGIYLPGKGGVRIEDDVVVTADGCETLPSLPRDLIVL